MDVACYRLDVDSLRESVLIRVNDQRSGGKKMKVKTQWHEITDKDWDKLNSSEKELFIVPICGKPEGSTNSQRIAYAGTAQALARTGIKSLRVING